MYKYLKGKLVEVEEKSVVVEVGGVGYIVGMGAGNMNKLIKKIDKEIVIWTFMRLTEEEIQLFGFLDKEQVSLFKKLISVSGVGPKSALSIMDLGTVNDLLGAIETADASFLSKASGIGKKTAQRLIVELRGKLALIEDIKVDKELEQALKGLGYSRSEYKDVVDLMPADLSRVEDKIGWVLRKMGGRR